MKWNSRRVEVFKTKKFSSQVKRRFFEKFLNMAVSNFSAHTHFQHLYTFYLNLMFRSVLHFQIIPTSIQQLATYLSSKICSVGPFWLILIYFCISINASGSKKVWLVFFLKTSVEQLHTPILPKLPFWFVTVQIIKFFSQDI